MAFDNPAKLAVPFVGVLFLAACGTLTGIPSHGGGKRFAIEQELVAGTVRAAAKDLDVSAIRGRRAAVFLAAIGDTGTGNLVGGRLSLGALLRGEAIHSPVTEELSQFPVFDTTTTSTSTSSTRSNGRSSSSGVATTTSADDATTEAGGVETVTTATGESTTASSSSTTESGNSSTSTTTVTRGQTILDSPERKIIRTRDSGRSARIDIGYNGIGGFDNSLVVVARDTQYLSAILQQYLVLRGVQVVPPEAAEFDIYIAVDVFGTVRSRTDWLVRNVESLKAKTSLEMTIIERATGRVVTPPQVASYEAEYIEEFALWMGPYRKGSIIHEGPGLMVDFRDVVAE